MAKSEIAPHVCPQCGSPCYQGAFALECTKTACDHYHADTAAAYRREQFPGVDSIEDEKTPTYAGAAGAKIWPAIKPAAMFPDTDAELAQQIRDGVDEALKEATPDEAEALRQWRDEILRDYLNQPAKLATYARMAPTELTLCALVYRNVARAFDQGRRPQASDIVQALDSGLGNMGVVTSWTCEKSLNQPDRLDITITYTRPVRLSWAKDKIAEAAEVPRKAIFLDDDQQGKLDAAIQAHSRELRNWWANAPSPTAKGEQLDRMADLMGGDEADLMVVRAPGETDEELRARLRKRWGQFGPGASL